MIDTLSASTVPKTLILALSVPRCSMAILARVVQNDSFRSFKDSNGPKWLIAMATVTDHHNILRGLIVYMLVFFFFCRLVGREGNSATFPGSHDFRLSTTPFLDCSSDVFSCVISPLVSLFCDCFISSFLWLIKPATSHALDSIVHISLRLIDL